MSFPIGSARVKEPTIQPKQTRGGYVVCGEGGMGSVKSDQWNAQLNYESCGDSRSGTW